MANNVTVQSFNAWAYAANSASVAFDCNGGNLLLVGVLYHAVNPANRQDSLTQYTVTFDGQPLVTNTVLDMPVSDRNTGVYLGNLRVFYLSSPPAGLKTLSISHTYVGDMVMAAVSLGNVVAGSTPFRTFAGGTNPLPSVTTIDIPVSWDAFITNENNGTIVTDANNIYVAVGNVGNNPIRNRRMLLKFPTTSLASVSTIESVELRMAATNKSGPNQTLQVAPYDTQGSAADPQTDPESSRWFTSGFQSAYVSNVVSTASHVGETVWNLGSTAKADLAASVGDGMWNLVVRDPVTNVEQQALWAATEHASLNAPYLRVSVTTASAGSPNPSISNSATPDDNDAVIDFISVFVNSLLTWTPSSPQIKVLQFNRTTTEQLLVSIKSAITNPTVMSWPTTPDDGWGGLALVVKGLRKQSVTGQLLPGRFTNTLNRKTSHLLTGVLHGVQWIYGGLTPRRSRFTKLLEGVFSLTGAESHIRRNFRQTIEGSVAFAAGMVKKTSTARTLGDVVFSKLLDGRHRRGFVNMNKAIGDINGVLTPRHNRWFQPLAGSPGNLEGTVVDFWYQTKGLRGTIGGPLTAIGDVGRPELPNDHSIEIFPGTTNFMINGGFEQSLTDWSTESGGTLTRSSNFAKYGTQSLRAESVSSGIGLSGVLARGRLPLTVNTQYTVSAWIYIPSSHSPNQVSMQLRSLVGTTGELKADANMAVRDAWQRVWFSFATTDDTTGEIEFFQAAHVASDVVYIDGVQLEPGELVTPYVETVSGQQSRAASYFTGAKQTLIDRTTINAKEGWVAMALHVGWDSSGAKPSVGDKQTVFYWRDNTDMGIWVYYDHSDKKWKIERKHSKYPLVGLAQTAVKNHVLGERMIILAAWQNTSSQVKIAIMSEGVDPGAFSTGSDIDQLVALFNTVAPGPPYDPIYDLNSNGIINSTDFLLAALDPMVVDADHFYIGNSSDGQAQLAGTIRWVIGGSGTVNDAFRTYLTPFHTSDPDANLFTTANINLTFWEFFNGPSLLSGATNKKSSVSRSGAMDVAGTLGKSFKLALNGLLDATTFLGTIVSRAYSASQFGRAHTAVKKPVATITRRFKRQ